jgi:hypothetical protein
VNEKEIRGGEAMPLSLVGGWVRSAAVIIVWAALSFLCMNVCLNLFGDRVGAVGVPVIVVGLAVAWYIGERRDAP